MDPHLRLLPDFVLLGRVYVISLLGERYTETKILIDYLARLCEKKETDCGKGLPSDVARLLRGERAKFQWLAAIMKDDKDGVWSRTMSSLSLILENVGMWPPCHSQTTQTLAATLLANADNPQFLQELFGHPFYAAPAQLSSAEPPCG